ncbi:hypothetical protein GQ42DRAFT_180525 [Ramicandelaber brevisporus]|nr:hypothetical protein GQ42DRAFT_180525 [Ramicandelaber brevisporus]
MTTSAGSSSGSNSSPHQGPKQQQQQQQQQQAVATPVLRRTTYSREALVSPYTSALVSPSRSSTSHSQVHGGVPSPVIVSMSSSGGNSLAAGGGFAPPSPASFTQGMRHGHRARSHARLPSSSSTASIGSFLGGAGSTTPHATTPMQYPFALSAVLGGNQPPVPPLPPPLRNASRPHSGVITGLGIPGSPVVAAGGVGGGSRGPSRRGSSGFPLHQVRRCASQSPMVAINYDLPFEPLTPLDTGIVTTSVGAMMPYESFSAVMKEPTGAAADGALPKTPIAMGSPALGIGFDSPLALSRGLAPHRTPSMASILPAASRIPSVGHFGQLGLSPSLPKSAGTRQSLSNLRIMTLPSPPTDPSSVPTSASMSASGESTATALQADSAIGTSPTALSAEQSATFVPMSIIHMANPSLKQQQSQQHLKEQHLKEQQQQQQQQGQTQSELEKSVSASPVLSPLPNMHPNGFSTPPLSPLTRSTSGMSGDESSSLVGDCMYTQIDNFTHLISLDRVLSFA